MSSCIHTNDENASRAQCCATSLIIDVRHIDVSIQIVGPILVADLEAKPFMSEAVREGMMMCEPEEDRSR